MSCRPVRPPEGGPGFGMGFGMKLDMGFAMRFGIRFGMGFGIGFSMGLDRFYLAYCKCFAQFAGPCLDNASRSPPGLGKRCCLFPKFLHNLEHVVHILLPWDPFWVHIFIL